MTMCVCSVLTHNTDNPCTPTCDLGGLQYEVTFHPWCIRTHVS